MPKPQEIAAEAGIMPKAPPMRAPRWIASLLICLFAVAAWFALVVKVPETVRCAFVLISEKGADPIQAPLQAEIRRVSVTEGQEVKAGAELFALYSDEILTWQTQLKTAGEDLKALQERSRKLDEAHEALLKIKNAEIAQMEQELKFRQRYTETVRDFVGRAENLASNGIVSQVELLRNQLELAGAEKDLFLTQKGLQQVTLQREQMETDRARQRTEEQAELGKLKLRMGSVRQQLEHCAGDVWLVCAPYDGVVISLAQYNAGSMVHSGQELCQLARVEGQPQVRLWVQETGLARLASGQRIRLFFDAFPYQRYGTIPAKMEWVSPAAVKVGEERRFVAQATLGATTIRAGGEQKTLRIGMKGEARVAVGERTLIEYAFEPIRQLRENFGK